MLGIVIATHGSLSAGLKDAAEVIFGFSQNIETVSLEAGADINILNADIAKAINTVNQDDGVVILTDLINASPYNQSLIAVRSAEKDLGEKTYVIGGTNLPILLETINHQIIGTPVDQIPEQVLKNTAGTMNHWNLSMLSTIEDGEDEDF